MGKAGFVSSALQLLQIRARERSAANGGSGGGSGGGKTPRYSVLMEDGLSVSVSAGASMESTWSSIEGTGTGTGTGTLSREAELALALAPSMDTTATNSLLSAFQQGAGSPTTVLHLGFLFHPRLQQVVNKAATKVDKKPAEGAGAAEQGQGQGKDARTSSSPPPPPLMRARRARPT